MNDQYGHFTVLDAKRRVDELRKLINTHSHAYYNLGRSTVTDAEYDAIFNELKIHEAKWPQVADPNSPTCRIGSPVMSSFQKVKHERKMLSLDNAYSADEVSKFFQSGLGLIVEPKIDGLSLSVHYKNGHLIRAVTRGDGQTGDDVTANARVIRSIPLELSLPLDVEIRGEVYMPSSAFEKINSELSNEGEEVFANPRNAAAGTLKQKDSRVVAKRSLAFIAYNVGSPQKFIEDFFKASGASGTVYYTHGNTLSFLGSLGFITPLRCPQRHGSVTFTRTVLSEDAPTIELIIKELGQERESLDLQTDGLVFKVDNLTVQSELGEGTRSPKWATAYKFPPERKPTLLKRIEVSIGRLGTLTPVAILEPVQLSGTTVERASLCNQDEVQRLGIDVGDIVYVEKSAEIIPKIMGLVKKGKNTSFWLMPKACPSCGSPVVKDTEKVAYRCPNKLRCDAQAIERLKHALGKSALDWDGFGEEMVKTAVEFGIRHLSQLFEFSDSKLKELFKPAFVKKFMKERERVKTVPLWRKIHSLGVPGLGKTLSQDLCVQLHNINDMYVAPGTVCGLIGEVVGNSFRDYINENVDEIEKLDALGFTFAEAGGITGPLIGKTFCITGGLVSGKRDEVEARIVAAGGATKSSVSRKVSFLIVGESPGADKLSKAEKYGTAILTEIGLYEMMGIPTPSATSNPLRERGEVE
jgi:DNA ligase (NAD+)